MVDASEKLDNTLRDPFGLIRTDTKSVINAGIGEMKLAIGIAFLHFIKLMKRSVLIRSSVKEDQLFVDVILKELVLNVEDLLTLSKGQIQHVARHVEAVLKTRF